MPALLYRSEGVDSGSAFHEILSRIPGATTSSAGSPGSAAKYSKGTAHYSRGFIIGISVAIPLVLIALVIFAVWKCRHGQGRYR